MNNTTWEELPVYLTIKEASELVRISEQKLYMMSRKKGFPCARFGRVIRIPRDQFKEWVEKTLR